MEHLWQSLLGIGIEPKQLDSLQVSVRAVTVFIAAIIMVRVGDKRFLSRKTAFDAVLGFILASTLARAVNGSAPMLPTIVSGFVIVLLHRGLAKAAARSHWLGKLVKGDADLVIKDGVLVREGIGANSLSERDIMEEMRLKGVANTSEVVLGYMERNGEVSIIKKKG